MVVEELNALVGPTMIFSPEDICPLQTPHNDALVIHLRLHCHGASSTCDTGSSTDIITLECLKKLKYGEKDFKAADAPNVGFKVQTTYPLGIKKLPIRVECKDNLQRIKANFLVVEISMAYNVILLRPTLGAIKAVAIRNAMGTGFPAPVGAPPHIGEKFLPPTGMGTGTGKIPHFPTSGDILVLFPLFRPRLGKNPIPNSFSQTLVGLYCVICILLKSYCMDLLKFNWG